MSDPLVEVQYDGTVWRFLAPGTAVALDLIHLQDNEGDAYSTMMGLLMDHMVLDDWILFYDDLIRGDLPDDAMPEMVMLWLEEATGKPMSAVGALANVYVKSWGMVRGRLVMAGIPDPARQITSLAAMLDAIDVMIREGHKDEKETAKYEREVYKPRVKSGAIEKPKGFEGEDMEAQAAMLDALGE